MGTMLSRCYSLLDFPSLLLFTYRICLSVCPSFFFDTGSGIAQNGLELPILLPLPPKSGYDLCLFALNFLEPFSFSVKVGFHYIALVVLELARSVADQTGLKLTETPLPLSPLKLCITIPRNIRII